MLKSISIFLKKHPRAIILISIICSRISLLTSGNLNIDGDESIVGLMAKHFWIGQELPLFFYGQSYGFSLFEVIPIAIMYQLFGVQIISLKLAMLFIWSIGIFLFYESLRNLASNNNSVLPLLVTLLFVVSPSFLLWSMKARGGYLTAFTLASLVLYIATKSQKNTFISPLIIGGLCSIIYQAQPLWLPGLIPFIAYRIDLSKSGKWLLTFLTSTIIVTTAFYLIKLGAPQFWKPSVFSFDNLSWSFPANLFHSMYNHWLGAYEYFEVAEVPPLAPIIAQILNITTLAVLITGAVVLSLRKKMPDGYWIAWLGLGGSLSYLLLVPLDVYRYLIPLTGYALILLFMTLSQLKSQKLKLVLLLPIISIGFINAIQFDQVEFQFWKDKKQLVQALQQKQISHVYCQDGLMQWHLMFLSNEKVTARFVFPTDRYQPYVDAVDETYYTTPSKTAWVGFHNPHLPMDSENTTSVNSVFYIHTNPSQEYLKKMGFQLNEFILKKE